MANYIKGNSVANATSYELLKKSGGNLIDFKNPTNAPAQWSYDAAEQAWVMNGANYVNLRWDIALTAGVAVKFVFTFSELSGGALATIRDSVNTTLETIQTNGAVGTYEREFTPTESGTYSFRICGVGETASGVLSAASVVVVSQDTTYISLATNTEINFKLESLGILDEGDHTFVVKAKADGFEDSDYSNEVTVNIPLIYSFNITSVGAFKCIPGMTFAEWCDSKYNTAGFYYDENGVVRYGSTGKSIKEAGADTVIAMSADYTLISAG